jgi:DNA polymerase III epsilon subunit-like protein
VSTVPCLLPVPSASAYNVLVRAHDLPDFKGDRAGSVAWARNLVESGEFCILDSETTGLKTPVQFVEIAIVDADARTLFEGTVRPSCRIEAGATRIHGHSTYSLASSPPFWEVYPNLLEALWGKRVVVYNASYDRRVWDTAVRSLGARGLSLGSCLHGSVL